MLFKFKQLLRETQGTGASRRLRKEGLVPAVVYGVGEAQAIAVDHKQMFYALEKNRSSPNC